MPSKHWPGLSFNDVTNSHQPLAWVCPSPSCSRGLWSDWHTDAFNAAFVIPDLMYFLGRRSLEFTFILCLPAILPRDERRLEGSSSFLNVTLLGLVILTCLGLICLPASTSGCLQIHW